MDEGIIKYLKNKFYGTPNALSSARVQIACYMIIFQTSRNMFSIPWIMCRGGAGSLPGLYERQLKRRPRENDTKSSYRACAKILPSCCFITETEQREEDARAYELLNCSFYAYKDNTEIWGDCIYYFHVSSKHW